MTSDDMNAIIQQNRLLQEQNDLLREQNELLRQQSATSSEGDERDVFVEDIDHDEMRAGFLVTSHRKKLWNAQIKLINEFARICKKHNLRWFAYGGTLLGAARHKGYIPWDDDIDLVMLRPDYEKFKSVVEEELKNHPHYHTWYWFNYRLETDEDFEQPIDIDLPLISAEQEKQFPAWAPFHPLMRLVDDRTTFLMPDARKNVFYAVWIDLLCLDPCPPFPDENSADNFEISRELLMAVSLPEHVRNAMKNNEKFLLPYDELENFIRQAYKTRARSFELFLLKNYFPAPYVGEIRHYTLTEQRLSYTMESFSKAVYLPFEKIELPVPVGYDEILTAIYGDWHKLVITYSHSYEYSADIPYKEYFQKTAFR